MPVFRKNDESRPIISLGRRSEPYALYSDSEDDCEEIEFEKAVFERQRIYEPSRKKSTKKKLLFCLMLAAFLAIIVTVFYYYFSGQTTQMQRRYTSSRLTVRVDAGLIHGVLEDNVFVFRGIPYARPPSGKLRWRPSSRCRLNECWNGTFQASTFGLPCAQARVSNNGKIEAIGSENCLFINVWTPTANTRKKLPVMVYLHGGGLVSSSGNEAGLHPTPEMVKGMEIVGVSLNYRLNAFGFLALDILSSGSEQNTSGNYGFMDQIMALRWIQQNIKHFGGDPVRITLLGHGSGGTSVLALLASPLAQGLFHRAITLSPSADIVKSTANASKANQAFLTKAKCSMGNITSKLDCIYALSTLDILKSVPWNVYPWAMNDQRDLPTKDSFVNALAVVDGHIVPKAPVVAIRLNQFNDIPLILGNTAQEIGDRPKKNFDSLKKFQLYARKKLKPFLNGNHTDAFRLYKIGVSNNTAQYVYTTIASDIREVCPVEYLAMTAVKHFKSPVYRYVVTNTPTNLVRLPTQTHAQNYGQLSFHMWDLIAFFNFPKSFNFVPSQRDIDFKNDLRVEFQSFIYHGKVRSDKWLDHRQHHTTALFGNNGLQVLPAIYHVDECTFWIRNGFAPYAWIN